MPTPTPPSLIWGGNGTFAVDPPISQDATYAFTDQDRAYIDSQIRGLETMVLQLVAAGTPLSAGVLAPVATGSYSPGAGQTLLCRTSTGVFSVTVPTMVRGGQLKVVDYDQNSATNNITVSPPAGWVIQDPNTMLYGAVSAPVTIRTNGESVTWTSDGGANNRLFI